MARVPAVAQAPASLPWALAVLDVAPVQIPDSIRDRLDFDYDDTDSVVGARVDLNGDGVPDYIVRAPTRMCGLGGCSFVIFDGASARQLVELFGTTIFAQPPTSHGYPTLTAYTHQSAGEATLATFAFADTSYQPQGMRTFIGPSLDRLGARLRRIPPLSHRP